MMLLNKYKYIGIALVLAFAYYLYSTYTSTVEENERLNKELIETTQTAKDNEKKIIDAYEQTIPQIKIKTEAETSNEAAKDTYEDVINKLEETKKEVKHETITPNDCCITFSF